MPKLIKLSCLAMVAVLCHSVCASDRQNFKIHPKHTSQFDVGEEDSNGFKAMMDDASSESLVRNVPRMVRQVKIPLQIDTSGVNIHQYNLLSRQTRDVSFPGIKKPTHHDVIIPNWNPNAKTKPWQLIGVRNRKPRNAMR